MGSDARPDVTARTGTVIDDKGLSQRLIQLRAKVSRDCVGALACSIRNNDADWLAWIILCVSTSNVEQTKKQNTS
jgi:hypothetical protein